MNPGDDWPAAWQPMQDAVGRDFAREQDRVWGEVIEAGAVRRYLEPLEFSCALHDDAAVARAHGHADLVVPFTALATFAMPLMWRSGDAPLFIESARDAQPARTTVGGVACALEPPTTHFFAVSSDADFIHPALVGQRISRHGAKLLSCTPKQTRLGRGAFMVWQTEVINDRRELLARLRTTMFRYNPVAPVTTGAGA